MADKHRALHIKITGEMVDEGVSLRILSNLLQKLQENLNLLGKSRSEIDPSLKGRTPGDITKECELYFIKAEPGSLNATIGLSSKRPLLFPNYPNFGENVLDDLKTVVEGISENSTEKIHKAIPNSKYRKKIFSNFNSLLPTTESKYSMSFSFEHNKEFKVTRPSSEMHNNFVAHTDVSPIVEDDSREIVIQATCIATPDKDGKIDINSITSIIDYKLFQEKELEPYITMNITWNDRTLYLFDEMLCNVFNDGHFIIVEHPSLNIRAYALSIEDAINDFNEELFVLWDEIALLDDNLLSSDALELKRQLLSIVKEEK